MPLSSQTTTYRARIVLPGQGEPIDDGAVSIVGERIVWVGPAANAPCGEAYDLGDVAIIPGLVNAHSHLEFSSLAGPLGRPGMAFPDWIRSVVEWRRTAEAQAPHHSLEAATVAGLEACARFGVTGLGEIARPGWPRNAFEVAPLETTAFWEAIGPTAERARDQPALTRTHLDEDQASRRIVRGVSPHAPYTVRLELLDQLVSLAARRQAPVAMHLAESPEELELLQSGTGPFVELLERYGASDGAPGTYAQRPLAYLERLARAPRSLVIHGNYLANDELWFLADNSDRMALVYCPRTHAYFGHARHPLPRLLAMGGAAAIGTDSLASNPDLDLWEELKFVAREFPEISPSMILDLGTRLSARAIGLADRMGTIEPGQLANLAVVDVPNAISAPSSSIIEGLFDDAVRIVGSMHRGVWIVEPYGAT